MVAMKRTEKWIRWLTALVAFLFALACAEVLLRFVWENPFRYDQPDRVVKLRLHQANTNHPLNRSIIHPEKPHTRLRTGERSYIQPSLQYENPDVRVAFLGGSTTECFAVAESLRFPTLVSTLLAEHGLRVSTMNAGKSGSTVHDSINNLLNHVVADRPDFAVMMHACNDIGVLEQTGDYASRQGEFFGWSAIARATLMRLTNHSYTLAIVRQTVRERTYLVPSVGEQTPRRQESDSEIDDKPIASAHEFESRLRIFVRACHAFGIRPVLMTQPVRNQFNDMTPSWVNEDTQVLFNRTIRQVAQEEQAGLVDLVTYLEDEFPDAAEQNRLFYDGLHVNDHGSEAYAQCIVDTLLPLIREQLHPSSEPIEHFNPLAEEPQRTLRR